MVGKCGRDQVPSVAFSCARAQFQWSVSRQTPASACSISMKSRRRPFCTERSDAMSRTTRPPIDASRAEPGGGGSTGSLSVDSSRSLSSRCWNSSRRRRCFGVTTAPSCEPLLSPSDEPGRDARADSTGDSPSLRSRSRSRETERDIGRDWGRVRIPLRARIRSSTSARSTSSSSTDSSPDSEVLAAEDLLGSPLAGMPFSRGADEKLKTCGRIESPSKWALSASSSACGLLARLSAATACSSERMLPKACAMRDVPSASASGPSSRQR
mmetsp:Transcript_23310/g.75150  ORF Transcript_23310/g.75150 Transcript_23310/m.75150 type:complete len:269 (-) Transcript_23310:702-1508(-)